MPTGLQPVPFGHSGTDPTSGNPIGPRGGFPTQFGSAAECPSQADLGSRIAATLCDKALCFEVRCDYIPASFTQGSSGVFLISAYCCFQLDGLPPSSVFFDHLFPVRPWVDHLFCDHEFHEVFETGSKALASYRNMEVAELAGFALITQVDGI